jgi:hypothetical protein
VGVAGDVHLTALVRAPEPAVYFPLGVAERDSRGGPGPPWAPSAVALVLRTAGDPAALVGPVRRLVGALDPGLAPYDAQPLAAVVRGAAARTRLVTLLLGLAGGMALALGAIGLYGVIAYGVRLRRRELGVRLALGARPAHVRWLAARRGLGLAMAGIALGLLGALAGTRVLAGLLYGVGPLDPAALGGTCIVLFAVALAASWLPSRRAAMLPMTQVLRGD